MGASTNVSPTNVIPTNDNLMSLAPQMPDIDDEDPPQAGDGDPPGDNSDNTAESEAEEANVVQRMMERLSLNGGNSQVTGRTEIRKSKRIRKSKQIYSP